MNALTFESGIAIAPTTMIADALRDTILLDLERCTVTNDAALDLLRDGASKRAALALGAEWHDPRESFMRAFGSATRGGIPAVSARGILIGAFGHDYGELCAASTVV